MVENHHWTAGRIQVTFEETHSITLNLNGMPDINHTLNHSIANGSQMVNLSISLGDGQSLKQITVRLANGNWISGQDQMNLGDGNSLRGKQTFLAVRVTDTNPRTNWTSNTVRLTNSTLQETYVGKAEEDNGFVTYYIQINHR
ncbi:MAG: hypothetical protein AAGB22_05645 [Bacteroidota bacterium]